MIISGFLLSKDAEAGAGDNIYGFAWSSNIGWIKFNNCAAPPNPATCSGSDFGVNIDPGNGLLSGYAWSDNIGWLSFDPATAGFDAAHPQARLDLATNEISGWARFLSNGGGWDGWVKLRDPAWAADSVMRNGCDLEGFAWGDLVAGWIKFKDTVPAPWGVKTTECEVINDPPVVTIGAPSVNYPCPPSPVSVLFPWGADDPENNDISQWRFQADDSPVNWLIPDIDRSGGPVSDPYTGDRLELVSSAGPLFFGRNYEWRVKAIDELGADSGWVYGPSINNIPASPRPNPSFECSLDVSPRDWRSVCDSLGIVVNEKIFFRNINDGYNYYGWDFDYDAISGFIQMATGSGSPPDPEVEYTFTESRPYEVRHKVDEGGLPCEGFQILNIYEILPIWREISPS